MRAALGEVSSPSSDLDEGDMAKDGAKGEMQDKAACTQDEEVVKCRQGHVCSRLTHNPAEPGYDEPAVCDGCDAENLPGSCPYFYHCGLCEFDLCPHCVKDWSRAAAPACNNNNCFAGEVSATANAAAGIVEGGAGGAATAASVVAESVATAPVAAGSGTTPAEARGQAGDMEASNCAAGLSDDGGVLLLEDLPRYAVAMDLVREVHAEKLKRSLQRFGLKCGGKPEERAARLMLLKTVNLHDMPKSALMPKPK